MRLSAGGRVWSRPASSTTTRPGIAVQHGWHVNGGQGVGHLDADQGPPQPQHLVHRRAGRRRRGLQHHRVGADEARGLGAHRTTQRMTPGDQPAPLRIGLGAGAGGDDFSGGAIAGEIGVARRVARSGIVEHQHVAERRQFARDRRPIDAAPKQVAAAVQDQGRIRSARPDPRRGDRAAGIGQGQGLAARHGGAGRQDHLLGLHPRVGIEEFAFRHIHGDAAGNKRGQADERR